MLALVASAVALLGMYMRPDLTPVRREWPHKENQHHVRGTKVPYLDVEIGDMGIKPEVKGESASHSAVSLAVRRIATSSLTMFQV